MTCFDERISLNVVLGIWCSLAKAVFERFDFLKSAIKSFFSLIDNEVSFCFPGHVISVIAPQNR